jgi:hypothetical protein
MKHTFETDLAYERFLSLKAKGVKCSGFEVSELDLNANLFDFQKFCVTVALKKGRMALMGDCGLGKTIMQLEWSRQVVKHTGKPVLILAPLAVTDQTIAQGELFGFEVVNHSGDIEDKIYISNYEQLENIDCSQFAGIVLDESSILKNFEGEYKKLIIETFKETPYRLACTATPSPNDDIEICNHAEFLGVGTRSEILAMYFTHDGGETAKWRLKGHAEDRFWQFVSEWALMFSDPSDLGFDGSKYVLPKLNLIKEEIKTPIRNEYQMYNDVVISAINFNAELRNTIGQRLDRVAEIVNGSKENFIVWIKQDVEGDYLRTLIPDAIEVKGSDKKEVKKKHLLGFANNEFRVLITKAKIAQFGLNYQNCHNQVFASPDFSFESIYQCIRRSLRFGQKHDVNIYLVVTDTMQNVLEAFKRKEFQFMKMKSKLKKYVCQILN